MQEIEEFTYITQLAGLTDHIPVGLRLRVSDCSAEDWPHPRNHNVWQKALSDWRNFFIESLEELSYFFVSAEQELGTILVPRMLLWGAFLAPTSGSVEVSESLFQMQHQLLYPTFQLTSSVCWSCVVPHAEISLIHYPTSLLRYVVFSSPVSLFLSVSLTTAGSANLQWLFNTEV